jgi:hypothetical protein
LSRGWGDRDHFRIPSGLIKREPKPTPKFKIDRPPKTENFIEKGNLLSNQLEDVVSEAHREKPVAGENIFLVLTTKNLIDKEHDVLTKYFNFSLQTGKSSAIVGINESRLQNLRYDLKIYTQSEKQKTYISQIHRIARVRINKVSPELNSWMKDPTADFEDIEIDLLPNMGKNYYEETAKKIATFLEATDVPIVDSFFDNEMASIRTKLKPSTLYSMIQGIDSIWQARKSPELFFGEPQGVTVTELPQIEQTPKNLLPICVLDTGVDATHPLMGKEVLTGSHDFTPDNNPSDFNGHGTFVAGIAAYYDLEELMNRKLIAPLASVISAKIQSRQRSQNKKFLEKRITQAVELLHSITPIFSLSIMYPGYCNYSKSPSKLAHVIDKLSKRHNVIFVISSGNLDDKELQSLNHSSNYPQYFTDKHCLTYHGAEACSCLTVGGISHKINSRSMATQKGQPSPFTRRGEFKHRYKPDLSHFAGNLEIDPITRTVGANKTELGVASIGINKKQVAYDMGTSYSAPMVANILARVKEVHPDASLNLLKALLIHSASWPEAHSSLSVNKEMKKVLYGKGRPSFEKAAYCDNYSPTYIIEGSLMCNEIANIPFYVPEIMRKIWDRRIRITLVYDPPVNPGVEGYTLVDLDFKLFKQLDDDSLVEQGKGTRWTNDYRLPWDNVKSDVYTWQQSGWGKDWRLQIIPETRFRNMFKGQHHVQNYAVVISIENPSMTQNIYEEIDHWRRKVRQIFEVKPTKQQILVPHQAMG